MSNRTKGKSIGFCAAAAVVLIAAGAITRLSIADSPKKASDAGSSDSVTSGYTASYSDSRNILNKAADSTGSQKNEPSDNESEQSTESNAASNPDAKSSDSQSRDKTPIKDKPEKAENTEKAENAAGTKTVSFALPLKGDIIRKFDMTQLIYSKTFGDMRVHNGIDIKAKDGETVQAAADGTVKEIREDPLWGNMIVIDHGGSILSYYCGLNDVTVKVGDSVKLSKIIGTVGECAAECLDETHLHFSMTQNGEYVSPLKIMGLGE